jgi:ABC-type lipoprotein release transport system permease subunit
MLELQNKIKNLNLKYQVSSVLKSWQDINSEMAIVIDFQKGFINMIMTIIAIAILITIMTPIMMIWQERKNELAMLKILGINEKQILIFGIYEAILMGGFAFILALLIIGAIIGYEAHYGIDLMFLTGGKGVNRAGIRLEGLIYPLLHPQVILVIFFYLLSVLVASYYWSIKKIINLKKVSK